MSVRRAFSTNPSTNPHVFQLQSPKLVVCCPSLGERASTFFTCLVAYRTRHALLKCTTSELLSFVVDLYRLLQKKTINLVPFVYLSGLVVTASDALSPPPIARTAYTSHRDTGNLIRIQHGTRATRNVVTTLGRPTLPRYTCPPPFFCLKVMVRLRANEVVDDRVLLARAEAEITRLKNLLREALDSAMGPGDGDESLENFAQKNDPSWSNRIRAESAPAGMKGGVIGDSLGAARSSNESPSSLEATTSQVVPRGPKPARDTRDEAIAAPVSTATPAAAATAAAATAAQRRHAAKLIAENERLRESNDRLRADVQGLLQSNRKLKRRRGLRRLGFAAVGRGAPPFSSPVDWSARYAYAAANARRRRPSSTSSPLRARALPPHARSVSPGAVSSSSSSSIRKRLLPVFRMRRFGGTGDEGEGTPVEDALSPDEVRAIIGDEATAVAAAAATIPTTPRNQEEAEEVTQLEMFRRELEKPASAAGEQVTGYREGQARGGALVDGSTGGADNTYNEALLVRESQRLEDLMFEAHVRERRRLHDERGRLASARTERLELESQLARLAELARVDEITETAELADGVDIVAPAAPVTVTNSAVPPVPALPLVEDTQQSPKALEQPSADRNQPDEHAVINLGSERPVARSQGVRNSSGWADPSTVDVDTAAAVAATTESGGAGGSSEKDEPGYGQGNPTDVPRTRARARRLVPASSIPERRQTGRITPISARRKPSHQRPSTSGGPSGRARSRRAHRWAGGSRSPVRGRATALEPAFTRERSSSGGGGGQHRQQQQQQAEDAVSGPATHAASSTAKLKALQVASQSPLASPRKPRKVQGLRPARGYPNRQEGGGGDDRGDLRAEVGGTTKGSLACSVADLGLRLKVRFYKRPVTLCPLVGGPLV